MREYVDTQQKPLSRTITASPQKRGRATMQAALDDEKTKDRGIQDVQEVFTELTRIMGCSNWDMQQYVRTTLGVSLIDFQKQIRDRFSGLSITLRALGEEIVKMPEVKEMYRVLKKGDDSLSDSGNVLMDFMKNIRYSHFTYAGNVDNIKKDGLTPAMGGSGMSQEIMRGSEVANSRKRWSEGYTFVTRNGQDRNDYSSDRVKLDVFVPPTVNLVIDLDSYGFKSSEPLTWIGHEKKLNAHALEGFQKLFLKRSFELEPNIINDIYNQIDSKPTPPTQVIPSQQPAPEPDVESVDSIGVSVSKEPE